MIQGFLEGLSISLILKLLYEYNHTKFEKVLNMHTDEAKQLKAPDANRSLST